MSRSSEMSCSLMGFRAGRYLDAPAWMVATARRDPLDLLLAYSAATSPNDYLRHALRTAPNVGNGRFVLDRLAGEAGPSESRRHERRLRTAGNRREGPRRVRHPVLPGRRNS